MFNDLPQHSFVKQFTISHANIRVDLLDQNLPMSNAARKQIGLDPEQLRSKFKNEHLLLHDLHLGQDVMFQDSTSKQWFPTTISSLCSEPRSYKITTKEGVTYRKTQVHLKPQSP